MKRQPAATVLVGVAVVVALVGGAGGCLPEGGPGIGERVLEARGVSALLAGQGDSKPLLFTRWIDGRNYAGQPARVLDLYHVPPGQQIAQRVQEDIDQQLIFDSRGRLYLQYGWASDEQALMKPQPTYRTLRQLRRVDLAAGTTTELGWIHELQASPGKTHMVAHLQGNRWLTRSLEDDVREIAAGASSRMYFVGDDVCVLDDHRLTCVLLEGGTPFLPTSRQVLLPGGLRAGPAGPEMVITVADEAARAAGREEATQLWLVRLRDRPGQPREILLAGGRQLWPEDATSGESQVAALDGDATGPVRLRLMTFGAGPPVVRELVLPAVAAASDPDQPLPWSRPRVRPGRAEVWVLATDGQLAILRADGSHELTRVAPGSGADADAGTFAAEIMWTAEPVVYESMGAGGRTLPTVRYELFTSDGRWWAYRRGGLIHLADADNPGAPSRLQTPVTPRRGIADIEGQGRLVLWSSFGYRDEVQVRLHDRDTLAFLGTLDEVRRLMVGRRGMLALVTGRGAEYLDTLNPGKLVLATTDGLAPGPVALLAENVTRFAVITGCAGCDPIQAGNHLAYLVHARVPWKYDGLWLAELP